MQKLARLWFAAASLGILLFTSGCFRPGGAALESTNAALGVPTFTIAPSDTPPAVETSTPVVQTVVVTQIAQLPTEAVDPVAEAQTQLAQVPSSTPDPFAVSTATPPEVDPFALLTGTAVANANIPGQVQQEQDPFAATLTAQAGGGVIIPTQDPALLGQPLQQLDPPFQTATAVIVQATLNVAIEQTQTAAALFGPTPTPPPAVLPTATSLGGAGGIVPTQPPQILPGQNCIYVVQVGDNLFRIGLRFGVAYQQIASANGILNPNLIYPGQQLTIPGVATNCTPLPITPFPVTPPPGGGGVIHTVMQGETLYQLSVRYGPTVHQIAAANGIQNINLIYIGQQLVIP
jgi:LysM repeat protein